MTKSVKVQSRISEYEMENWMKFINESENLSSVSELIRFSVSGYISEDLIEKKLFRVYPKLSLEVFHFTLIEMSEFDFMDKDPNGFIWLELLQSHVIKELGISETIFNQYLKKLRKKFPGLIDIEEVREKTLIKIGEVNEKERTGKE